MSKIIQMKDSDGNVYPETAVNVYTANKNVAISAADTPYDGAEVTVPAGVYIATGHWNFSASTVNKTVQLDIQDNQNRVRSAIPVLANHSAVATAATVIVATQDNTTIKLVGRASQTSASNGTYLRVVRIASLAQQLS